MDLGVRPSVHQIPLLGTLAAKYSAKRDIFRQATFNILCTCATVKDFHNVMDPQRNIEIGFVFPLQQTFVDLGFLLPADSVRSGWCLADLA